MLKDGFAGCTPAVRRPTYKPQKGRQRFPVGADSISARGGSLRRALSSGRGPGLPGPYRVAAIFCAKHKKIPACRKRCVPPLAPSARGLRPQAVGERTVRLPEIFRAMARFSPSAPSGHLPRRGRFFDSLRFFARSTKKSPTVRSRERWGQNAISRPLKRRRAKRQNGGAACYWQEPHRRGKQPVDGSRLVMVSRR